MYLHIKCLSSVYMSTVCNVSFYFAHTFKYHVKADEYDTNVRYGALRLIR